MSTKQVRQKTEDELIRKFNACFGDRGEIFCQRSLSSIKTYLNIGIKKVIDLFYSANSASAQMQHNSNPVKANQPMGPKKVRFSAKPLPVRRGRGRPPGSKNRVKI